MRGRVRVRVRVRVRAVAGVRVRERVRSRGRVGVSRGDLELCDRLGRSALHSQRPQHPSQHRGSGPLDVVVEAEVDVAVLGQ